MTSAAGHSPDLATKDAAWLDQRVSAEANRRFARKVAAVLAAIFALLAVGMTCVLIGAHHATAREWLLLVTFDVAFMLAAMTASA